MRRHVTQRELKDSGRASRARSEANDLRFWLELVRDEMALLSAENYSAPFARLDGRWRTGWARDTYIELAIVEAKLLTVVS